MSDEYKPINNLWKDSEGYRYFGTLKLSSKIKYAGDDFIQLWEWVKQLQQENKQLKEELEYTIRIVEHNRIINEKNKEIHEIQTIDEAKKEYMLLGLRKIEGVNITEFKNKFIDNPLYLFRKELSKLVEEELIEIDINTIKLTNKGIDLANIVWEEFV